ncbi:MAG: hypothetical protein E7574_01265 [Ruminococcaceae bacterium]|nr:hypothetical protein [Oscillospiraceae bacterium]
MPITFLLNYLFGIVEVEISDKDTEKALNLLHVNKISAEKMKRSNSEYFSFTVRYSKQNKVVSLLDKSGIKVYSIRGKGLPFFLKKYKKRYGLFVGVLFFCAMLWSSKLFVWDITFSGNENIPDSVVEEQLIDVGFGVGSFIPKVNFYKLCNEFLISTEDFSFVSVNMEGTTAKVELRERKVKEENEEFEASNLVAKYSGQIESMTVYSGASVVEKEAVVKEGDLLVSGFLEKKYGFEIVRSTGSVYAYVTRKFEVEIPFEKNVKIYTGENQKDISVTFFGKKFGVFSDVDKSLKTYDTFTDRERLVLFDMVRLPLIMTKNIHKGYIYDTVILSEAEAKNEAEREMTRILAEELVDSEVLERKTKEEIGENSYKLICEIYCITDIALEKEIILK